MSLFSISIPRSYEEALLVPGWKQAMDEDMNALFSRGTCELVSAPKNIVVVSCRWVYTLKYRADGSVDQYKVKLDAKGNTLTYNWDYFKIFFTICLVELYQDSVFYCYQSVVAIVPIEHQECLLVW